jgi:D-alanyl-D-alanine carboxypeptidase
MTVSSSNRLIGVVALVGTMTLATASVAPARELAGTQPEKPGPLSTVQQALDEVVAAGAPGAIALVRVGNKTVHLSSGNGNLDPVTPIHAGDLTRIGGVTKSFTATVVLQLVGEGMIALEDAVEQWVPGAISNGDAISVRQLLNHTSGISDYVLGALGPYFEDFPNNLAMIFDPAEGVRIAAEAGPLYAPGEGWNYSNTNSLLLAMIVEAATGHSFGSELEARIFRPLKLTHTSYPTSSVITGSHVRGYFPFDGALLDMTPLSPTLFDASGGILSNAQDVARFYEALLRGRLLEPELLEAMQTIDPVATNPPFPPDAGIIGGGWGLGLLRETFPCGDAWGHDSETPGYMTAVWSNSNATRQVVVIVNTSVGHDEPVAAAMRAVLAAAYCPS